MKTNVMQKHEHEHHQNWILFKSDSTNATAEIKLCEKNSFVQHEQRNQDRYKEERNKKRKSRNGSKHFLSKPNNRSFGIQVFPYRKYLTRSTFFVCFLFS